MTSCQCQKHFEDFIDDSPQALDMLEGPGASSIYASRNPFPPEIWLYIVQNHLVNSSATVAALSTTSQHFNMLLRTLKYRDVSVKLEIASAREVHITSSALRFAALIQNQPDIIRRIEALWIGHEETLRLRAIDDEFSYVSSERNSLCYILSQNYPNLRHFTLSFKYATLNQYTGRIIPTLPDKVLRSILSTLSLPSLTEVTISMGSIPLEVYTFLQERRISALNFRGRIINQGGFRRHDMTNWRVRTDELRTLRIDESEGNALNVLFPSYLHIWIYLPRLTTLVLKCATFRAPFNLPKFSCPTVDLQLYFTSWHDCAQGSDVVDLKFFEGLRTLTMGFNLSQRPQEPPGPDRLAWIVASLRTIKSEQPIDTFSLFIDDLCPTPGWVDRVRQLPWSEFQDLFSLSRYPSLRCINVILEGRKKTAFAISDWEGLEQSLRASMALFLDQGLLHLHFPSPA